MISGNEEAIGPEYYPSIGRKYFTVDFKRRLKTDSIVSLSTFHPENEREDEFLSNEFPNGISRHGYNYLYNPDPKMDDRSDESEALMMGLIMEQTRKAKFPNKVSRYQCLFACETFEEALFYRADQAKTEEAKNTPIYEVYTKGVVHRGDMNLINTECTILELYRRVTIYWSSDSSLLHDAYKPFWEILLPLPVFVASTIG